MGEGKDPIFYADTLNKFAFIKPPCGRDVHTRISPSPPTCPVHVSHESIWMLNVITDGRAGAGMDQLATLMAENENNINGIILAPRIAYRPIRVGRTYTGCKELSRKQSRLQTRQPCG